MVSYYKELLYVAMRRTYHTFYNVARLKEFYFGS